MSELPDIRKIDQWSEDDFIVFGRRIGLPDIPADFMPELTTKHDVETRTALRIATYHENGHDVIVAIGWTCEARKDGLIDLSEIDKRLRARTWYHVAALRHCDEAVAGRHCSAPAIAFFLISLGDGDQYAFSWNTTRKIA